MKTNKDPAVEKVLTYPCAVLMREENRSGACSIMWMQCLCHWVLKTHTAVWYETLFSRRKVVKKDGEEANYYIAHKYCSFLRVSPSWWPPFLAPPVSWRSVVEGVKFYHDNDACFNMEHLSRYPLQWFTLWFNPFWSFCPTYTKVGLYRVNYKPAGDVCKAFVVAMH